MPNLTQKSQVTVPKQIRLILGLKPGDEVDFNLEEGKVILHKKRKKLPFEKWRGYLGRFKTYKLMEEIR
jgi:AbrB family looped-hinge helix DNA binding protein